MFVKTSKIIVDSSVQIRASLSEDRVNEFLEIYDSLPPIKLVETSEGLHYLADGFHRHEAGRRRSVSGYECDVEKGDLKKALEIAIERNCRGPLSLSRDEKRMLVDKTLKFFPERANSWVAEMIGVSMQLVESRRGTLEDDKSIKKFDKLETRDGREYPRQTKVKQDDDSDIMDIIGGRGKVSPTTPLPRAGDDISDMISRPRETSRDVSSPTSVPESVSKVRSSDVDTGSLIDMFVDGEGLVSTCVSEDGLQAIGVKSSDDGYMMFFYDFAKDKFYPSSSIYFDDSSFIDFVNSLSDILE